MNTSAFRTPYTAISIRLAELTDFTRLRFTDGLFLNLRPVLAEERDVFQKSNSIRRSASKTMIAKQAATTE
jgi:hypothetical protein